MTSKHNVSARANRTMFDYTKTGNKTPAQGAGNTKDRLATATNRLGDCNGCL